MEKTTIQINMKTLERLRALKRYERESYGEIVNSLINESEDEELSEEEIEAIKRGLDDKRKERTYSIEEVAKELGIKLK